MSMKLALSFCLMKNYDFNDNEMQGSVTKEWVIRM
jgi:hypothetical protein